MKIKTILAATATAMLLSTTSLSAQSDTVIDTIVQELVAMGYTHIEIKKTGTSIKVEATGADGKLERVYDKDGVIVKEEISAADTHGDVSDSDSGDDDSSDDDDHDGGSDDSGDDDHGDDHGDDDSSDDHDDRDDDDSDDSDDDDDHDDDQDDDKDDDDKDDDD